MQLELQPELVAPSGWCLCLVKLWSEFGGLQAAATLILLRAGMLLDEAFEFR